MTKLQLAEKMADLYLNNLQNSKLQEDIEDFLEHEDNDMPEEPKPKGTAAKDIKTAMTNDKSSIKKYQKEPIDNDISDQPAGTSKDAKNLKKAMEMK